MAEYTDVDVPSAPQLSEIETSIVTEKVDDVKNLTVSVANLNLKENIEDSVPEAQQRETLEDEPKVKDKDTNEIEKIIDSVETIKPETLTGESMDHEVTNASTVEQFASESAPDNSCNDDGDQAVFVGIKTEDNVKTITSNDSHDDNEDDQTQSEDDNEEETDVEDAAPVRRRRGRFTSNGEELFEDDAQSEENLSEDDNERDVIVEDEEGEIVEMKDREVEEETNEEKEDTENPQFVPKHGMFFMHDNRTESNEDTKELPVKKKLWDDKGKWGHDRFNLEEQGPKSYREVINMYGYDIREQSSPPTYSSYTRGRGKQGRGRGGQRSRPLVSDYIENSSKKSDQTREPGASPQRKGFGRGLQRGRRRTYPNQSEERMVDDVYGAQNYQTSSTENSFSKSDNLYTNKNSYNEKSRSSKLKEGIPEVQSQKRTNRKRIENWDKTEEIFELTSRLENGNNKRDTRYRDDRTKDTFKNKQENKSYGPEVHWNFQSKEAFNKDSKTIIEKDSTGNKDLRYGRKGGFFEVRGRGRSNENTPFEDSKRTFDKRGAFEGESIIVDDWPSLVRETSHVSNKDVASSSSIQWTNKESMQNDKKEIPNKTQKPVKEVNTHSSGKSRISKEEDTAVEEISRESKSFSQRRHQRSTIKEIPKIPLVPQLIKETASGAGASVANQAPRLLQNFQIRLERGQRMIIDEDSTGEKHNKSKEESLESTPAKRVSSQPHKFSTQRQGTLEGRLGIQDGSSDSPQHYYETGYPSQVYQSEGTPPPNIPDSSHTPQRGMMRQNIQGSPSPRLLNQGVPPQITDTRPPQSQLSDAAALLPNRLPVQGLQSAHQQNTAMLHPAVSMGAHPPQGAFPPTTFVNVHYNPGHPVPQPVHPRPAQGLPVQPRPVQGHPGPPHGQPGPVQRLPGPAHGHPRPAQGLTGPMTAPYQIATPVPVQHFPVTNVPQAGTVAPTQNIASIGPQMQQEVMIDNHGLTYKGATYYSPEVQFGMQRAPQKRQPQPVRIEAPPATQNVENYQENI